MHLAWQHFFFQGTPTNTLASGGELAQPNFTPKHGGLRRPLGLGCALTPMAGG